MFKEWVDNHFFQYLLLMAIIGLMLGIVGTYIISFILAIQKITELVFSTWSGGYGG